MPDLLSAHTFNALAHIHFIYFSFFLKERKTLFDASSYSLCYSILNSTHIRATEHTGTLSEQKKKNFFSIKLFP